MAPWVRIQRCPAAAQVAAVAWVQSLAQELSNAEGAAKEENKTKKSSATSLKMKKKNIQQNCPLNYHFLKMKGDFTLYHSILLESRVLAYSLTEKLKF